MYLSDIQKARIKRNLADFPKNPEINCCESTCVFNGRMFQLRSEGDGTYHADEMTPTGVLYSGGDMTDSNNFDRSHLKLLRNTYRSDPNGFSELCDRKGIDLNTVCRSDGRYTRGTIYHPTMQDAICAVITAIETNTVLKSFVHAMK